MTFQKLYFKTMDRMLPSVAAKQVYKVMSNPKIRKFKDFEEEVLAKAHKEIIKFKHFDIQTYSWGEKNDKVALLIHGWEGHAGNFGALVEILVAKGFYVVSFDAPSHGKSSIGTTSMLDFAELTTLKVKEFKPKVVISHSFGSVTSAYALRDNADVNVDKWILVTTPHDFKTRIKEVSDYIGITHRTTNRLIKLIEEDTKSSVDTMNMDNFGHKLGHVSDVIVVHSTTDRIIPIAAARNTHKAIPQSTMIELDNLGHYAILWSDELKEIIKKNIQ